MHDKVRKAIAQGQGSNLRYFFVDSLDIDPTFASYKEDFEYCQKNGAFELHRELTPFRNDEQSWDKNYWLNLKVDLQENFSEERLCHMINVAKIIYKGKIRDNHHNEGVIQQKNDLSSKVNKEEKKYPIIRISPKDDKKLKQDAEIKKAREEHARQDEIKRKALVTCPNVPDKYIGGQDVKKSQGIPLLPISVIIALVIVLLVLLLK